MHYIMEFNTRNHKAILELDYKEAISIVEAKERGYVLLDMLNRKIKDEDVTVYDTEIIEQHNGYTVAINREVAERSINAQE